MTLSRMFAACVFAAAVAALGGALLSQYAFGLKPCELCVLQRLPYAAVLVLSGVAAGGPAMPVRAVSLIMALCAFVFAVDAGLAVYHTGVEQHWWMGPRACTGGAPLAGSVDQLRQMLAGKPAVVQCDVPAWRLLGVSMAGYNIVYAAGCALFAAFAARRLGRTA